MNSVTSNAVARALKPSSNTANQYMVKGDGVASIDITNVGIRLNKVSKNQYHIHLEPARFIAKSNAPQGYFSILDFKNAFTQLYNENRGQTFSNEVLMYIYDETSALMSLVDVFTSNKQLYIRSSIPWNAFTFVEGHSYMLLGDIDMWLN